jgi:hypothetical protein
MPTLSYASVRSFSLTPDAFCPRDLPYMAGAHGPRGADHRRPRKRRVHVQRAPCVRRAARVATSDAPARVALDRSSTIDRGCGGLRVLLGVWLVRVRAGRASPCDRATSHRRAAHGFSAVCGRQCRAYNRLQARFPSFVLVKKVSWSLADGGTTLARSAAAGGHGASHRPPPVARDTAAWPSSSR